MSPEQDHSATPEIKAPVAGEPVFCETAPGSGVQCAELYNKPGVEIDWSNHPYTRTDGWNKTEHRRALIVAGEPDDRHTYYLRDDILIDVDASADSGKLTATALGGPTKLPNITIGESAIFTDNEVVSSVIIATETQPAGEAPKESKDSDEVGLFAILESHIGPWREAKRAAEKEEKQRTDHKLYAFAGKAVVAEHPQSFRFRDERYSEISRETRGPVPVGGFDNPARAGVTNVPEKERIAANTVPPVTSRAGKPISPQPGLRNASTGEDNVDGFARDDPPYEERLVTEAGQNMGAAAKRAKGRVKESRPGRAIADAKNTLKDALARDASKPPRRKL